MAADQALAFGVVLADGRFVTADPESHPDVYWALRGGGGSTFGVVVSITVKAYADMPTSISTFAFDPSSRDLEKCAKQKDCANDDFWAVIKHYFSLFPAHADEGIYSYFNIFPNKTPGSQTFTMIPYFAPRKTAAEVDQLLASTVKLAASLGISLQPQTVAYEGFYDAWKAGFPKEAMGQWNGQSGSRLFPRSNWDGGKLFEKQFDVIREVVSASYLIAFNIAPTYKAGGVTAGENAVLPAWRETVMHGTRSPSLPTHCFHRKVLKKPNSNFGHDLGHQRAQLHPHPRVPAHLHRRPHAVVARRVAGHGRVPGRERHQRAQPAGGVLGRQLPAPVRAQAEVRSAGRVLCRDGGRQRGLGRRHGPPRSPVPGLSWRRSGLASTSSRSHVRYIAYSRRNGRSFFLVYD